MRLLKIGALVCCLGGLLGCAPPVVGHTAEGARIVQIKLRLSNAYLIQSHVPVLVDAGTIGDMHDLAAAMEESGTRPRQVATVIVTHAHGDHSGLAEHLQRKYGAQIMLGAGDVAQAARGHNDPLRPMSFTASVLEPFITQIFPTFVPDVVVRGPVDLAPWGIAGHVIPMPGHTAGSVVVVLANRSAFVGDQMLGGAMGGALFPRSPGEHYYQADPAQNRRNIDALLKMGVETFYLGHGGPVSAADVRQAFAL